MSGNKAFFGPNSHYPIDYNPHEAEFYLHNLNRGAVDQGYEQIKADAERLLSYLRDFERDFERLQQMLGDSVQSQHYRAEDARKEQKDPSPHERLAAELNDRRVQNEYVLKDVRLAIRTVEDYLDAVNRARFWGEELSRTAEIKTKKLMKTMEDYASVRLTEPDVFCKQVAPIRKLTNGGI